MTNSASSEESEMTEVKVMIVDDQPRARQGLKALLGTAPGIRVVGEATNGREAVREIPLARPDVVLMDVLMPEMDGLQATRLIKAMLPGTRVVVHSLYTEYRQAALAAGADEFLTKGCPSRDLFAAITGRAG